MTPERPSGPIIFSGPMVRAILAGTKTQTRRTKGLPQRAASIEPHDGYPGEWSPWQDGERRASITCPYGVPGNRLWVRETHYVESETFILYRADDALGDYPVSRWTPSIHMPRRASRITLEITDVRVQRLHEISAKDIIAEGAVDRAHDDQFGHNPVSAFDGIVYMDLMSLWAAGWNKINGKGSFEKNPWVWCLTFRRVP